MVIKNIQVLYNLSSGREKSQRAERSTGPFPLSRSSYGPIKATLLWFKKQRSSLDQAKLWTDYSSTLWNWLYKLNDSIDSHLLVAWTPSSGARAYRQEIASINRALSCEIGNISPMFKNKYTGIQSEELASGNWNPVIVQWQNSSWVWTDVMAFIRGSNQKESETDGFASMFNAVETFPLATPMSTSLHKLSRVVC